MIQWMVLELVCVPSLVGLWWVVRLGQQSKRATTSAELWAIADRVAVLTMALVLYAAVAGPLAWALLQFLP